jgi:hypothetical protein
MAIVKKLKADVEKDGAHWRAFVHHEGALVLSFGIRHSRDAANGHMPKEMHLNKHNLMRMASCAMSADDYFKHLKSKGII